MSVFSDMSEVVPGRLIGGYISASFLSLVFCVSSRAAATDEPRRSSAAEKGFLSATGCDLLGRERALAERELHET